MQVISKFLVAVNFYGRPIALKSLRPHRSRNRFQPTPRARPALPPLDRTALTKQNSPGTIELDKK